MPVFKDEERNTFYVKTYYTDYTGTRKQKMKRGFKIQKDAKDIRDWQNEQIAAGYSDAYLDRMQNTRHQSISVMPLVRHSLISFNCSSFGTRDFLVFAIMLSSIIVVVVIK